MWKLLLLFFPRDCLIVLICIILIYLYLISIDLRFWLLINLLNPNCLLVLDFVNKIGEYFYLCFFCNFQQELIVLLIYGHEFCLIIIVGFLLIVNLDIWLLFFLFLELLYLRRYHLHCIGLYLF